MIRRNEDMHLAMRHLGLVPVLEGKTRHEGFQERVDRIRQIVEEGLDMDRIQEIAKECGAAAGSRARSLPGERSTEKAFASVWPGMRLSTSTTGITWS